MRDACRIVSIARRRRVLTSVTRLRSKRGVVDAGKAPWTPLPDVAILTRFRLFADATSLSRVGRLLRRQPPGWVGGREVWLRLLGRRRRRGKRSLLRLFRKRLRKRLRPLRVGNRRWGGMRRSWLVRAERVAIDLRRNRHLWRRFGDPRLARHDELSRWRRGRVFQRRRRRRRGVLLGRFPVRNAGGVHVRPPGRGSSSRADVRPRRSKRRRWHREHVARGWKAGVRKRCRPLNCVRDTGNETKTSGPRKGAAREATPRVRWRFRVKTPSASSRTAFATRIRSSLAHPMPCMKITRGREPGVPVARAPPGAREGVPPFREEENEPFREEENERHVALSAPAHRRAASSVSGAFTRRASLRGNVARRRALDSSRETAPRTPNAHRARRSVRASRVGRALDGGDARAAPPVPRLRDHVRGPEHARDERGEAEVRGEETGGTQRVQAPRVRVRTPGAVHARVGPDAAVLQHVSGEVEHREGYGDERQNRGSVPVQTRALAFQALPTHHLREIGHHRERHAEGDGVRELLGGFRRGDAREAGEQQGPASAAHQRGHGKEDRHEARPDAQVSRHDRTSGAGARAVMHDAGGLGDARERPVLRCHVSGGALLVIPLEEVLAQVLAARRAHREPRGRGGAAAGRREAEQRAVDLGRDQDAGWRARRLLRRAPRDTRICQRLGIDRIRTSTGVLNPCADNCCSDRHFARAGRP